MDMQDFKKIPVPLLDIFTSVMPFIQSFKDQYRSPKELTNVRMNVRIKVDGL